VRTGFTDIRRTETGRAPQHWHPRQASQEDRCSLARSPGDRQSDRLFVVLSGGLSGLSVACSAVLVAGWPDIACVHCCGPDTSVLRSHQACRRHI
jgi:hypothetical protein